jgi:hypothetical protein
MFDESILELEAIEFGEDRWHPSVVEARYKTYRDAKAWELAMTMARVMAEGMPDRYEWLKNQADAMTECGDTAGALQLLKDASERFGEDGKYLLAVGRQMPSCARLRKPRSMLSGQSRRTVLLRLNFLMILRLIRCGRVFNSKKVTLMRTKVLKLN